MEFILAGQPNAGKSTIFNEVVGYKAVASNFPGVTVKYIHGEIELNNNRIKVTDLPGTYSLQSSDEAERVASEYLSKLPEKSVIINVLDSSVLSRSLELTLQLAELGHPMVVALNMVDEAEKKGIKTEENELSEILGVPVIKTIGRKGKGVFELFSKAQQVLEERRTPKTFSFETVVDNEIDTLVSIWETNKLPFLANPRYSVIKLIEKNTLISDVIFNNTEPEFRGKINSSIKKLEKKYKKTSEDLLSSIRHSLSFEIFENTSTVESSPEEDFRNKIDNVLMHPFFGFLIMGAILYLIFWTIFTIGNATEPLFLSSFAQMESIISGWFGAESFLYAVSSGIVSGFGGGVAIVIPFLLPFFLLLAVLEDTGYLARIAYLIDNIMHKIGLHGLSIVPMILGYGCTVPGILATRILKSRRDKIITATLTTLVPCTARMAVIFGLVGFFISMKAAILIYVLNIALLGITGKIMSALMPEISPGLILEIPKYHIPSAKALAAKTWFRLKEFVVVAWPILIAGSVILEIIKHFRIEDSINSFTEPFTAGILGLPAAVGVTLIFGIMRKELALILLFTALGTSNVITVMSQAQIYGFTIFVTFYIPCLATFAALGRELNWKNASLITILTFMIAVVLSVGVRYLYPAFI